MVRFGTVWAPMAQEGFAMDTDSPAVRLGKLLGHPTTEFEVKKLMGAIDLAPGLVIPYARVEEILGLGDKTNRFWSITDRWRREVLAAKQMWIRAPGDKTFRVLTPAEQVTEEAARRTRRVARGLKRKAEILVHVDVGALGAHELRVRDHDARVTARLIEDIRKGQKEVKLVLRQQEPMPRLLSER